MKLTEYKANYTLEEVKCYKDCACGNSVCSELVLSPPQFRGVDCEFAKKNVKSLETVQRVATKWKSYKNPVAAREKAEAEVDAAVANIFASTQASLKDASKEVMINGAFEEITSEHFRIWKLNFDNYRTDQNQFRILDGILSYEESIRLDKTIVTGLPMEKNRYRPADVYHLAAPETAKAIENRISEYIPTRITDEHGLTWVKVGLNNGFLRLIRYVNNGDSQPIHYDLMGNRLATGKLPGCQDDESKGSTSFCQTMITFNMYLNPPTHNDEGGLKTHHYDGGLFTVKKAPSHDWFVLTPQAGRAFLFRQGQSNGFLHDAGKTFFEDQTEDSDPNPASFKSILRIDVVYKPLFLGKLMILKAKAKKEGSIDPQGPEIFKTKEQQELAKGIHDDILTDGYKQWKQRLDAFFEKQGKGR